MAQHLPQRATDRVQRVYRSGFRGGFRAGIRDVLSIGRFDAAPVIIRVGLGSVETDRRARYRDVHQFRVDVEHERPTAMARR